MYLVLCASNDLPALWAYRGLLAAGLDSVDLITGETLASATLWEHRVGAAGVETSVRLPDGRPIHSRDIRGVLNRLPGPPQDLLACAVPADRDYALQELTAFYLSWLHGLGGAVYNPPTPQGLAGRWRHASEWVVAAHEAGFTVPAWRQDGADSPDRGYASMAPPYAPVSRVVVLENDVFGAALPPSVRARCVQLAAISRTPLLGIDLFPTADDPWTFAAATPMPDLQIGGEPLLGKLAELFQNGAKQ
jgi:hypothetical protein